MSTKKKFVLGMAAGLSLGAGIFMFFYFKKKKIQQQIIYQDKRALLKLLDEISVHYAPILNNFAKIFKSINQSTDRDYKEKAIAEMRKNLEDVINRKDQEICQKFGFSREYLDDWIQYYENDPEIQAQEIIFQSALESVLLGQMPDLRFQLPSSLTMNVFNHLYKKIYAFKLFETHRLIQKQIFVGTQMDEKTMKAIEAEVEESIKLRREELCKFLQIPQLLDEDYETLLMKAFFIFGNDLQFKKNNIVFKEEYSQRLKQVKTGEKFACLESDPSFLSHQQFEEYWLNFIKEKELYQSGKDNERSNDSVGVFSKINPVKSVYNTKK